MKIVAGSGGEPAVIGDHVIDAIRAREKGGLVVLPEPPRLKPGDKVRITTGFLTGALAVYSGMRGADRVAVLLGFLGTLVLPAANIEPAG